MNFRIFPLHNVAWLYAIMGALMLSACGGSPTPTEPPTPTATTAPIEATLTATPTEAPATPEATATINPVFELSSSAFGAGETIPEKFACTGEDLSPELIWGEPPEGTQSFLLVLHDPDAGGFIHWVAYNLPADLRSLPEGVPQTVEIEGGGVQGRNTFGELGYRGPCPPAGAPHTYVFALYALNTELDLDSGVDYADVAASVTNEMVLAAIETTGEFSR